MSFVRVEDWSEGLRVLMDGYLHTIYAADPFRASMMGAAGYDDAVPDASAEGIAKRVDFKRAMLISLERMPSDRLTEDEKIDRDLLHRMVADDLAAADLHLEQYVISALNGPHIDLPQVVDQMPIESDAQLASWATRLKKLPKYIDDCVLLMREGMNAGRVPPRVILAKSEEIARRQCSPELVANPRLSAFYRPFVAHAKHAVADDARAAVRDGVIPAFARFADFLRDEYIPACRESIGASAARDGDALYAFRVRASTTTNMTPEEVHQLGLKEVARIRAEMFEVIARTDFAKKDTLKGDELFAAFVNDLRDNPRFYYTDKEDLLRGYRDIAKRIDAALPTLFGKLPRNSYGVREMPTFMAPTAPTAYYNYGSLKGGIAGSFVANTYALDQRPKWGMIALTMHEAVPGHHLQFALQDELEHVHPLRRLGGFEAFVEGWALYAERLGLEVTTEGERGHGLYTDPYDDFGRLTFEMWRACRLVVDTGIHAKGWTRQQAIDFMLSNSALTRHNVIAEVDRYIGWPGQACAYKIGELKIRELRARAEQRLGAAFDLRAFHDEVLGAGALPLDVLEARIDRWIDREMKRPANNAADARPASGAN
ncbi:MAG: DUF885 domain-containing protein [Planctomycetota bacterium]|nr:DUF885 domain-containing protein [Planctomycetota bacterium]